MALRSQQPARLPQARHHRVAWIVCCDEGYSSSLAAASLQVLGLHKATDLIGGFRAWRAAGLPVSRPAQPVTPWLPRHDELNGDHHDWYC